MSDDERDAIKLAYEAGSTMSALGRLYHRTPTTIREMLVKEGVAIRGVGPKRATPIRDDMRGHMLKTQQGERCAICDWYPRDDDRLYATCRTTDNGTIDGMVCSDCRNVLMHMDKILGGRIKVLKGLNAWLTGPGSDAEWEKMQEYEGD